MTATPPKHHRFNIWARTPIWARLLAVAAVFIVGFLAPSFANFMEGILLWGFLVGVVWTVVRAVARKVRD